ICIGTNTAEAHPVIATRIKSSQKLDGKKVIVSDLRKHELAERADLFIRPNPGSDLVWLNAVTKYIIDNDKHDKALSDELDLEFDKIKKTLQKFTLKYTEVHTGL